MKRVLAMLLAAVLLLGSVTACSENKPDPEEKPQPTAGTPTAVEEIPEETEYDILAYLGEADWQGREFTVVGRDANSGEWEMFELNADEETGEPLNDAVFARNLILEERYNLKVVGFKSSSYLNDFRTSVLSDTADFEGALLPADQAAASAAEGLFYNFNALPGLDLENIWFDQNARKKEIIELSRKYGLDADLDQPITELAVGAQQRVEILKALYRGCDILVLDEPTAALTDTEA